jgi:hypothetical protein
MDVPTNDINKKQWSHDSGGIMVVVAVKGFMFTIAFFNSICQ